MKIPEGFLFSGVSAGIKSEKNKKDLGLIYSEKDALVGGVFTQNKFPSAHVQYCREIVPSDCFRALIVNSGNANAATGTEGLKRNERLAMLVAQRFDLDSSQVLTSSTGVIGHQLPVDKVERNIENLRAGLSSDIGAISEAILTTDLKVKKASADVTVGGQSYSIVGFAKGSGMIHPNMATMLAYVITDAPIPFDRIQSICFEIAEKSFNRVSVDGDTSTNDSFFLISNNQATDIDNSDLAEIIRGIETVAISLAKQIAADGEGAEHLIEVSVTGAPSEEVAKSVSTAVITSSLVKTAVNGKDPNWGRVLMATGNGLAGSSVKNNSSVSISIQDCVVFQKGEPVDFDEISLAKLLADFEIRIEVNLHSGDAMTKSWGCDLSSEYIRINADYTT